MKFISGALADLMATPQVQPQSAAEQANLCMEERIGSARQATYEGRVDGAGKWDDWREHHYRYLKEEVHRRYPLSAAFAASEPSLRPGVEANQFLLRVERIDGMLHRYSDGNGTTVDADQINHWIAATTSAAETSGRTGTSLADLGRLVSGATSSPETAALEGLTEFFNQDRRDGRPSFVAFDAEFPSLADQPDWARQACERCGLAITRREVIVTRSSPSKSNVGNPPIPSTGVEPIGNPVSIRPLRSSIFPGCNTTTPAGRCLIGSNPVIAKATPRIPRISRIRAGLIATRRFGFAAGPPSSARIPN